jgi:aspartate aminotransferase
MKAAQRMASLGTETAFEVLAKAKALEKQGKKIIHLEIGEPDFDTPRNIRDAAIKAINDGHTHYTPAPGILELREAIAEYLLASRKLEVSPDEVVVTPGAKPIIFFSMLGYVEPGDEVLVPDPGFPIYGSVANFLGAKVVSLPLREEDGFGIADEDVTSRITKRTKMIVLNSPSNPTGGTLTEGNLKALADAVKGRDDVLILSDEIYNEIRYGGRHQSIATLPGMKEKTIVLDGFSKTFAMTGWRLGYGAMPKDVATKLTQLAINSVSCSVAFVQMAGIEALRGPKDEVRKMVDEFGRRRKSFITSLNKIGGVSCTQPSGAFYAFPNVKSFGLDSKTIADGLLNMGGVASLSGTSFGKEGEGYLRLSFANSLENLNAAVESMSDYFARLGAAPIKGKKRKPAK